ncbi:MAG: LAGLIDADG family homing endonuclease [Candidatus Margulisbacteria bacterium]|nr:LAGLIDADG family homing endonuclease [Candidatus Margulisiibacteriota bacterium]MBU1022478.1 LAGLIDADG family homing endonuclease [Candidatus Margulisiibacteriota bacterium]MBU1728462.1 LAGLIDADG family homing endonuclease [Candidatus Margulisiibacteriota bacterium]MBU1954609.1 LAGLIDADG family homing endonuclease [Candidatus Margulisiibacteriota bacterium]
MKEIIIDKDALEKLYSQNKCSIYEIAKTFNCSPALISKKLKLHNIKTWWQPVKSITKEELQHLYCDQNLTIAEIAAHFNCGKTTIISKMQAFNIPSRKKTIILSIESLETLYGKYGLKQKEIANLLNCNQATISNKMKEAKVKARDKAEISTKYPKHDFSNNLTEKAYMIGFRLGDLHVRLHRKLISVDSTTTRQEQIKLIKNLFNKYTHVLIRATIFGHTKIHCLLNQSFRFLLKKEDKIPKWILNKKESFLAFLAGYTDAEGCIGIYTNKSNGRSFMFILRTYDKNILNQIWEKVSTLGIVCPKTYLCTPKGQQNNNKDFWKFGVYKKDSLKKLFNLIKPYCKHPRILSGIQKATKLLGENT